MRAMPRISLLLRPAELAGAALELGSPRYTPAAWASQALGMALMVDPSSTGTCSANDTRPGACSVELTGPLRFDAKP